MAHSNTFTVAYRRKREGKTDYRKRLKLVSSGKLRLVVRRSQAQLLAQIAEYGQQGDRILASAKSSDLGKLGWKYNCRNSASAYLLGLLIGKKAKDKKISEGILDLGMHTPVPGSRFFAVLKGAVDAGLQIPHSKDVLPKEDRIMG